MSETPVPGIACNACPLRPLPTFQQNSAAEIDFIQWLKMGELSLRPGAEIFHEGEPVDRLYTLLSGWAFRFKTLPDGRRQILNFLLPGDLVGLQAKLFDHASHGVEALTPVRLCAFSRDRIWEVFRAHPELAFDITWLGAREEAMVDDGLLSVGRRFATERVAALLLHLHQRAVSVQLPGSSRPGSNTGAIALPVTQAHIADALGLSVVHTNRTLQALRAQGLFELAEGTLRVLDPRRLRIVAQVDDTQASLRPLI